jgi:hypothetical protein
MRDVEVAGGCGYDILLRQFKDNFKRLQDSPEDKSGKGRYVTFDCTRKGLYDCFHAGKPYDKTDLALSHQEFRAFFVRFRVCLVILDITGRIDRDASYALPTQERNKHLRPTMTWMLQHNGHLYLLRDGEKALEQKERLENSILNTPLLPLQPLEAEDEAEAKPPSRHYYLGDDGTPVQFIPTVDDLRTI